MSKNSEGLWLFEFEDGQSIQFAVHEAVEDRDECIELIEDNHGKVTEQLEDADFILFSHQTPGVEELLEDGRVQGKPAIDINWIHRCRGVERIVPWYSFQIGTRNLALTSLASEARDEHEMVSFMARYGPILTLRQSFVKLEHMFPHRSARKFRDLYTQRSPHLTPQIANLQQRLESVLKPPLRLVATKPRLNFSCSAPRLASTFDVHTNALESLDLCEAQEDTRPQTPPPTSILPSASMTSHFPSSSPSNHPALHLSPFTQPPPDDNTESPENVSTVTKDSSIPTHSTVGDTNDHTPVTVETNDHDVLHAGDIAVDSGQPERSVATRSSGSLRVGKLSMVTRSSGPLQVGTPSKESSAEEAHWAAAVEYTATHESNWKEISHWRGFIRWYPHENPRSATGWQTWFKRRGSKFVEDVLAAKAKRALDAPTNPDHGETSKTQSQNNANDVRLDNDQRYGDEDLDAIVEYLLANPYKSDERHTAYWKGFQTSEYKNGKSRTGKEWLLYYHHNLQDVIKPKVEKRARELNVETVLRINDEEIQISGSPVKDREEAMTPCRQEYAVESAIPQTRIEGRWNRQRKNAATNHNHGKSGIFRPYTLEDDVSMALYLETHPSDHWTRDEYWQKYIDWFPPANRPASAYSRSAARRRHSLFPMRERVREARARGIGTSESPEEVVKSLVRVISKRMRDKFNEDDEDDVEVSPQPSKKPRTKNQTPTEDRLLAGDDCQRPRSSKPEVGDPFDSPSSLSSMSSKPTS